MHRADSCIFRFLHLVLAGAAALAFAALGPVPAALAQPAPADSSSASTAEEKAASKITITTADNGDSTYDVVVRATCTGNRVELWGTVHLVVDGTEVDSGELQDGDYTFTTSELPAGDHTVKVTFDGNEVYAAGESEETQVTVS